MYPRKPILGETLIARRSYREAEGKPIPVTVVYVGRKYFKLTYVLDGVTYDFGEFMIENWKVVGHQYRDAILLVENEQQLEEHDEKIFLATRLSETLRYQTDWIKLSLEQIRAINAIIYP